jgi:hypothetical protein
MRFLFIRTGVFLSLLAIGFLLMMTSSCTKYTAQKAGEGAAMGAVVGAVGGLVTSLVFGGNPAEGAARGAVYGASTGATVGAISGAQQENAMKEKQKVDAEGLKKQIGEDAFNSVIALTQCKHEVALANARVAAGDKNKNKAMAGLWLQVLIYADNKEEDKARELFPKITDENDKISSPQQAEEKMRSALQKLADIREKNGLPRTCN